jgi:uncharacterized protein YciI
LTPVYVMVSTYLRPLDEVDAARPEHFEFLDALEAAGKLVGSGRQDPPIGGIVIVRAGSADEARAIMADDPFVTRRLATYEAVGWTPTRGPLARLDG